LLLFWIGVKLMLQGDDDGHDSIDGGTTLAAAIKTIIVADAVMSLDNVIAVAGASHGSIVLVTFGILVSIPIVVWGSKIVLTLMDRLSGRHHAGGGAAGLDWRRHDAHRPGHAEASCESVRSRRRAMSSAPCRGPAGGRHRQVG
jgi:predicted tellurium resistance membrane protein TerC